MNYHAVVAIGVYLLGLFVCALWAGRVDVNDVIIVGTLAVLIAMIGTGKKEHAAD